MKDFYIGMVNPITREPFRWDDPNVFSGDPGYYLEPGDPGYVPYSDETSECREDEAMLLADLIRTTTSAAANPRAITMYQYDIAPRAGGGFATQPVPTAAFDEYTVDSAVSAVTELPEQKCAEVLAAYMDQLFMCSAGNRWAHAIHNLLSMLPASAGSPCMDGRLCASA